MSAAINDLNTSIASLSIIDTSTSPINPDTRAYLGADVMDRYLSQESIQSLRETRCHPSRCRISPIDKYLAQAQSTQVQSLWSREGGPHAQHRATYVSGTTVGSNQNLGSGISRGLESSLCYRDSILPQNPRSANGTQQPRSEKGPSGPHDSERINNSSMNGFPPDSWTRDNGLGPGSDHAYSTRQDIKCVERVPFHTSQVAGGNDAFTSADIGFTHSTSHLLLCERNLEATKNGSFVERRAEKEVINLDKLYTPASVAPAQTERVSHPFERSRVSHELGQQARYHSERDVIDVDALAAPDFSSLPTNPHSQIQTPILQSQPISRSRDNYRSRAPGPEPLPRLYTRGRSPASVVRRHDPEYRVSRDAVPGSRWECRRLRSRSSSMIRHRIRSSRSRSPVAHRHERISSQDRRRRSVSPLRFRSGRVDRERSELGADRLNGQCLSVSLYRERNRDTILRSQSPGLYPRDGSPEFPRRLVSPDCWQIYRSRSSSPSRLCGDLVGRHARAEPEDYPIHRSHLPSLPADYRLLPAALYDQDLPPRRISTEYAAITTIPPYLTMSLDWTSSREETSLLRPIPDLVRVGNIIWYATGARKFSATTRFPSPIPPPLKRRPCLITRVSINQKSEVRVSLAPLCGALWSGRRRFGMYEDWWYPVSYLRNSEIVMASPEDDLKRNSVVLDVDPNVAIRFVRLKPSYLWVGDEGQMVNLEDLGYIEDTHMSISMHQMSKLERLHEYYALVNSPSKYPALSDSMESLVSLSR